MAEAVRTTCPYCGTGCGVVMSRDRVGWAVGGDPEHPANHGRLCSKGVALGETLGPAERLDAPLVDGARVGWDQAIAAVARRLGRVVSEHGPQAVAFYVSGQLLTEDYYVANKLLKGFIGSPHIDTNSRLCMASTVTGHKRAFGADVVPGSYADLDEAALIVLVGSNLAWCHPVLHRRVERAQANGARLVVIDPRRTATADAADLHLQLRPESDIALFNGLLLHLDRVGAVARAWTAAHASGLDATLEAAAADVPDLDAVAAACDLEAERVATLYDWFAKTEKVVTVFSQGANQSAQGTDKVNAVINVHLATGRIGRPGMGPFSVTGQPNAMGGREVGGLANQLAAHMDPDNAADVDRVRRFWNAPALRGGQGLKAVEMFDAVADGAIRAIWIAGTNPAVSMPDADKVRAALAACPLVIVTDVVAETDTSRYAHIRLPATAWSEKDGTVTNSERCISRQRAFRPPFGQARPDWWIFARVGQALNHRRAFAYRRPVEVFREHAALSAFENDGDRAFDIGALASIAQKAYDALAPVQWPWRKLQKERGTTRLFAAGGFFTTDRRARLVPVRRQSARGATSTAFPLVANTGRYRDQWHTMTRTGLSPRLASHRPEPLAEIHPRDAAALDLDDDDLAVVTSDRGEAILRVAMSEAQRPGEVFLPIHWSDAFAARAVVGRLPAGYTDPWSGQPESKHTPVRLRRFPTRWSAVLLAREPPDLTGIPYWCRHVAANSLIYELAGTEPAPPPAFVAAPVSGLLGPRIEYRDTRRGVERYAWVQDGRLAAALFVGPGRPAVARDWLQELFAADPLDGEVRRHVLSGQPPAGRIGTAGPVICSCFNVGLNQILTALRDGRATTAAEVGSVLSAGTGCGSCVPELDRLAREVGGRCAAE